MATTRNRKKQRLDQDLVRYQTALADAQARYDSVAVPKRKQYDLDVAAHQDTVARMISDYESQLQAYNVRVSEFQAAQQANAAQRQAALDAYQIEMQDFTRRRSDHEAEVLRMMESYGAQLTAQQSAYANQMEDYVRAYDQYKQEMDAFNLAEDETTVAASPFEFVNDAPVSKGQSGSAFQLVNDASVPTRQGGSPFQFVNDDPVGQRAAGGPAASAPRSPPTFSAQAPTRPALTNFPALPEAPVAPTSPRLPALELQMPSAPTMAALPPAPPLPDFSVEDGVLKEETARETELFDRRVAERKAGRSRARSSGGTRPMISAEQLRAAQQPSLSEGQSLGGTGFLGSN